MSISIIVAPTDQIFFPNKKKSHYFFLVGYQKLVTAVVIRSLPEPLKIISNIRSIQVYLLQYGVPTTENLAFASLFICSATPKSVTLTLVAPKVERLLTCYFNIAVFIDENICSFNVLERSRNIHKGVISIGYLDGVRCGREGIEVQQVATSISHL